MLLQSAAFGGVFTGFGIARDFESGFARRLMLAAPNRRGIVVGYALAALAALADHRASLLTVVALVVGMQVGGSGVDLFGLYALALLVNLTAAAVGGGRRAALPLDPGRAADADAGLPVLFLAPVYVPLDLLTGLDPRRRDGSTRSRA